MGSLQWFSLEYDLFSPSLFDSWVTNATTIIVSSIHIYIFILLIRNMYKEEKHCWLLFGCESWLEKIAPNEATATRTLLSEFLYTYTRTKSDVFGCSPVFFGVNFFCFLFSFISKGLVSLWKWRNSKQDLNCRIYYIIYIHIYIFQFGFTSGGSHLHTKVIYLPCCCFHTSLSMNMIVFSVCVAICP